MKYDLPPFNEKEKHGFIEQTLLDTSSELYRNQSLFFTLAIFINILFIYSWFTSKSVISILIFLFIIYLLSSIIISKFANFKRNK